MFELLIKILNYFRGYVIFRLEGLNLERVLNLTASKGIYFWDIVRKDYTTIEGKVGIQGYKELKKILKRTGCKSKIKLKIGYPFLLFKFKRKKSIIIGLILSFIIIMSCSSLIWDINIYGNSTIDNKQIITSLESLGLSKGVLKYGIDLGYIRDSLMIEYDNLSWVGITINGTIVEVKVIEKKEINKKIDDIYPCDIVAKKKGVVEKIIGRTGDEVVKKGDIVKPNDILISGTIIRDYTTLRYVHAEGEVWARTYYESAEKSPINKIIKTKTGNKTTKAVLNIGSFSIDLGKNIIPFDKYIVETKKKSFPKWRNIKIPVEIIIEEYYEIHENKEKIPIDVLKESLKDKLAIKLIKHIPKDTEILEKEYNISQDKSSVTIELVIEALEQIGIERKINVEEKIMEEENKEE